MLLKALSNPDKALQQAAISLALSALAVLGVIWLTIGLVQALTLWIPAAAASVIVGGGVLVIALTSFWLRFAKPPAQGVDVTETSEGAEQDLLMRGTHLAERLAQDSPMLALSVAIGTGWASVSCPPTLDPVISQIFASLEPESVA